MQEVGFNFYSVSNRSIIKLIFISFVDNTIGTNKQLDGAATDSSDEDASDLSEDNIDGEDDDDDLDNEVKIMINFSSILSGIWLFFIYSQDEEHDADGRPDEEPLNSEDDVTGKRLKKIFL